VSSSADACFGVARTEKPQDSRDLFVFSPTAKMLRVASMSTACGRMERIRSTNFITAFLLVKQTLEYSANFQIALSHISQDSGFSISIVGKQITDTFRDSSSERSSVLESFDRVTSMVFPESVKMVKEKLNV
jgi:DNA primase large subunit